MNFRKCVFAVFALMFFASSALAAVSGNGWSYDNGDLSISSSAGLRSWQAESAGSFAPADVRSITIQGSPTHEDEIDGHMFSSCTNLSSLTVRSPSSVRAWEIEDRAFANRPALTSVTLEYVEEIGEGSFENCANLSILTLTGLHQIDERAFSGCTSLKSVVIPESVQEIDEYAFMNCTGLDNITFKSSPREIKTGAFSGVTQQVNVTVPAGSNIDAWQSRLNMAGMTNAVVNGSGSPSTAPTDTPSADGWSYQNGTLTITTPEGLSAVMRGMTFAPADVRSLVLGGNIQRETDITAGHFANFTNIENITVSGAWEIEDGAFANRSALRSVNLQGARDIGSGSFANCPNLTSLSLGAGFDEIDERAFMNCTGLNSLTIPASIREIDTDAFAGCTGLTSVTFLGTPQLDYSSFRGVTQRVSVTIPAGASAADWLRRLSAAGMTNAVISGSDTPSSVPADGKNYSSQIEGGTVRAWSRGNGAHRIVIDVDFDKFSHVVTLDNRTLTEGTDYTASMGSTVITLTADCLANRVSNGTHNMRVGFTDGYAPMTLHISGNSNHNPSSGGGGGGGGGCGLGFGSLSLIALAALSAKKAR